MRTARIPPVDPTPVAITAAHAMHAGHITTSVGVRRSFRRFTTEVAPSRNRSSMPLRNEPSIFHLSSSCSLSTLHRRLRPYLQENMRVLPTIFHVPVVLPNESEGQVMKLD